MIFACYIGPKAPSWTEGKVYFAMAGFHATLAVDSTRIRLRDDANQWQEVWTNSGLFTFPSHVYAVVVKPIANLELGTVVQVTDADEGYLQIFEHGYLSIQNFEILDRTNVEVGNWVQLPSGEWKKIACIRDNLLLGLTGCESVAIPSAFRFPVSNGGVTSEPLLRCISPVDGELTEGNVYQPEKEADGLVVVTNDQGVTGTYMRERFSADL